MVRAFFFSLSLSASNALTKHFHRSGRFFLEVANYSFPKLELGEGPERRIWKAWTYIILRAQKANPSLPLLGDRIAQETPFGSFRSP